MKNEVGRQGPGSQSRTRSQGRKVKSGKQDPFQPIAGQLSESVVPSHFTEVPDTDREGRGFVRTRDRANWLGRFPKKVTVPTARTSFPSPPYSFCSELLLLSFRYKVSVGKLK